MNIQAVILGFLMAEPMTGYDIKGRFERSIANFFDASYGAIYPALKRMEKEGLITKEVVPQEGKPNKNVFAITETGKEEFFNSLHSPVETELVRSDFLVRMYFGSYVTPEQFRQWLEEAQTRVQAELQSLLELREAIFDKVDPYKLRTLDYGVERAKFNLAWLQRELKSE
jgi:DNA-binding PadR family transcriptional regulator